MPNIILQEYKKPSLSFDLNIFIQNTIEYITRKTVVKHIYYHENNNDPEYFWLLTKNKT